MQIRPGNNTDLRCYLGRRARRPYMLVMGVLYT